MWFIEMLATCRTQCLIMLTILSLFSFVLVSEDEMENGNFCHIDLFAVIGVSGFFSLIHSFILLVSIHMDNKDGGYSVRYMSGIELCYLDGVMQVVELNVGCTKLTHLLQSDVAHDAGNSRTLFEQKKGGGAVSLSWSSTW